MRRILATVLFALALVSCGRPGVKGYWDNNGIDYTDIRAAEDKFAVFAELAVASPQSEAISELDRLFDILKTDEVAYYIYSGWMESAFYSPLSPCRSASLFSHAVDRIENDGVFSPDECEHLVQKKGWLLCNLEGTQAVVPGTVLTGERTLVLVLDLSCPSCREALSSLAEKPEWASVRRVAIGCGHGPHPTVPGWEYVFPDNTSDVFDIHMTPVYFVVSPDGTVESSYKPAL